MFLRLKKVLDKLDPRILHQHVIKQWRVFDPGANSTIASYNDTGSPARVLKQKYFVLLRKTL
jgi:hypothetical protein